MTSWPHQSGSTETARAITTRAEKETIRFGHYRTNPEHFLLAIIRLEDDQPCAAAAALRKLVDLRVLRQETEKRMSSHCDMRSTDDSPPTSVTLRTLKNAVDWSHGIGEISPDVDGYGSAGLLIAIASCENSIPNASLLDGCRLTLSKIKQTLAGLLPSQADTAKPFLHPVNRLSNHQLLVSLLVSGTSIEDLFARFPNAKMKITDEVNHLVYIANVATTPELWTDCQSLRALWQETEEPVANQNFDRAMLIRTQIEGRFPHLNSLHTNGFSEEQLLKELSGRLN